MVFTITLKWCIFTWEAMHEYTCLEQRQDQSSWGTVLLLSASIAWLLREWMMQHFISQSWSELIESSQLSNIELQDTRSRQLWTGSCLRFLIPTAWQRQWYSVLGNLLSATRLCRVVEASCSMLIQLALRLEMTAPDCFSFCRWFAAALASMSPDSKFHLMAYTVLLYWRGTWGGGACWQRLAQGCQSSSFLATTFRQALGLHVNCYQVYTLVEMQCLSIAKSLCWLPVSEPTTCNFTFTTFEP